MIYSTSLRTSVTTTLNAFFELKTAATQSCRILEIGIMLSTGTTLSALLGRPTTGSSGMTFLTNGSSSSDRGFQPEQDSAAPAALTTIAIAGTTPAVVASGTTSPTLRRVSMIATTGSGVVWTFPKGLYVPPNATGLNSICLFNNGTGVACDVWIVIDE